MVLTDRTGQGERTVDWGRNSTRQDRTGQGGTGQRTADSGQRTVDSAQRTADSGQWTGVRTGQGTEHGIVL